MQKYKIGVKNAHFGGNLGAKLKHLSIHKVPCWKFAAVCWKIATCCPSYFFNPLHRWLFKFFYSSGILLVWKFLVNCYVRLIVGGGIVLKWICRVSACPVKDAQDRDLWRLRMRGTANPGLPGN